MTMTTELIERIATKLFFIEQETALIRKWLEAGTDKDPAFLAELQATNATHDPGADYEVAYVATPVEIPTDDELEKALEPKADAKSELVKRLDLEQESETVLSSINDKQWLSFVKTIMLAGWTVEKLKAHPTCENVIFTKAETELLKNLECLRYAMKGKDLDLNGALALHWVTTVEADVIKEFAQKEKLK